MFKSDRTYKMSSQTKRVLSNIRDPEQRSVYKRLMIEAEYQQKNAVRTRNRNFKETRSEGTEE